MRIKDSGRRLNQSTQRRLFQVSLVVGWIALLLVVLQQCQIRAIPDPNPVDVPHESSQTVKASRWGAKFLNLWVLGSESVQPTIDAMSSVPGGIALPRTPMSATAINELGSTTYEKLPGGDQNWVFEYEVIGTAAGERTASTRYYSVQFIQHGVSYQAVRSPLPINPTANPFRLSPGYTNTLDVSSTIGKAVQDFATAYLTQGNNASLGRTVSGNFKGAPLQSSPYQKATVKAVYATAVPPQSPQPGEIMRVLSNVNAEISSGAYSTVNLPLVLLYTEQGQWVVNELVTDATFGATNTSGDGGAAPAASSSAPPR